MHYIGSRQAMMCAALPLSEIIFFSSVPLSIPAQTIPLLLITQQPERLAFKTHTKRHIYQ